MRDPGRYPCVALEHEGKDHTMANITVSYDEIESAAARLGTGREDITQILQSLQGIIEGLVASGFVTDQASGRFNAAYRDYTTSANMTINKLGEIQSFMTQTSSSMREMDTQIAARIN